MRWTNWGTLKSAVSTKGMFSENNFSLNTQRGEGGGVEDPAAAFITILDSSPSRYRLKAEKASHLENLPLTETADNHCH